MVNEASITDGWASELRPIRFDTSTRVENYPSKCHLNRLVIAISAVTNSGTAKHVVQESY